MSKHNNYHNYNNYSNNSKVEEPVKDIAVVEDTNEVIEEPTKDLAIEEEVAVKIEPVMDSVEETEVESKLIGEVVDCAKLRVRKAPNASAAIICEIDVNSKVEIDENRSTVDFYKVCTEAGIEGFCMKKFIELI